MQKFGIVVDSTTVLEESIKQKFDVEIVDLNVIIDGESYSESKVSEDEIRAYFAKGSNMRTGSPSPSAFAEAYERLYAKGYRSIVVLPISSGLSSTAQSAEMAIELFEHGDTTIFVYEGNLANVGWTTLLDTFWDEIADGIEFENFIKELKVRGENSALEFTVTDLKNLHRSGRLSRLAAIAASVLRIKPVVKMVEGKLHLIAKVRTTRGVMETFVTAINSIAQAGKELFVTIVSIGDNKITQAIANELKNIFPDVHLKFLTRVNPVFMISLGEDGYGFAATAA